MVERIRENSFFLLLISDNSCYKDRAKDNIRIVKPLRERKALSPLQTWRNVIVKRPANTHSSLSSRRSASHDKRAHQELERFQSLVSELSAAMAQVPADGVDTEIERWLGKICLALDLDRSAIYERDAPSWLVRTSHTWVRTDVPPFPKRYDPEKLLEKTTQLILSGQRLVFSNPDEIPFELRDMRRFAARYGPKASAVFPIWAGGRVIGGASFGRFRSPRRWNPQLLEYLALVAGVFGGAIERKQAEAAARVARDELALAQRRSMMGGLVGSLTHELNQPLGAVLSNLGGLARLVSQTSLNRTLASTAVNNAIEDAKRAAEIVRRLRAMFKGNGATKTPVDIDVLVNEVVKLVSSEAALRQIRTEIRSPSTPLMVLVDRILLQQCLLNLLMNAFDALAEVDADRRKVTLEIASQRQGWVTVSVQDGGAGIHPSVRERLFEPFVTTKTKGMGLGLLVTRSIVEDHGGKLFFESVPEGGTTFTFTVPMANKKAAGVARQRSKEMPKA